MSSVRSVNVGSATPTSAPGPGVTGICKAPVASVDVRAPGPKHGGEGSGIVGDVVADRRHHGGDTQAVYAFAREELDWWAAELARELPDGMFGENLTTTGLDVDASIIGERWEVGAEVVLEVCGPRIPCQTFQVRMGERGWIKRFTQRGRSGAYLAVVEPGTIRTGDPIRVTARPTHGVTVPDVFRAWNGDHAAEDKVLAASCLWPVEHEELAARVAARETARVGLGDDPA
ncbi:MAG TPA: MOSC domain-containing protein [Acidimicrobiales bacterium]|jgi:MOSC domain-containing protein YiiM|nr:MOSC domain-containing protein [Acidimicrobiales bacterium]